MTFLTGLLASLIEWFLSKIGLAIAREIKQVRADNEVKKTAEADKGVLIKAKSDEEKELAAREISDHTFSP